MTITEDLRWNTYSEDVRTKAARSLELLRRAARSCGKEVKEAAFMALVGPQLEYANQCLEPTYYKKPH